MGGSMRYFCVVVMLAWTVGSADVFVADQRRPTAAPTATSQTAKSREQQRADTPKGFEFLFQSTDQRIREAAQRATYLEDLWKGLPYDSISLERGGTGGCLIACPYSKVTLYRGTVSGIVTPPGIAPDGRVVRAGQLRGRAELHTVDPPDLALADLQPNLAPIVRDLEGSIDVYTFANLSYLLYTARFLQLPDEYACRSCPADRIYIALSVAAGGKTKTVVDYGEGRPIELWAIQQAFDSLARTSAWSTTIKWTQE
jgi:hypothetical protein